MRMLIKFHFSIDFKDLWLGIVADTILIMTLQSAACRVNQQIWSDLELILG